MTADGERPGVSRPRKYAPRFSLRTLFVLLTLCSVIGWLAYRCERQRAAIAHMRGKSGHWITFAESWVKYPEFAQDYLATVAEAHVDANDTRLERLTAFPRLSTLTIYGIHDPVNSLATATAFSQLRNLRALGIRLSEPNNATLRSIAALPMLESLELSNCEFDDQRLTPLRDSRVVSLSLESSKIRDDDLADLPTARLTELDLCSNPISDQGLANLPSSLRLRSVGCEGTEITDAGLKHLRRFELQKLNLGLTRTGDVAMQEIGGMKHLQELQLHATAVTERSESLLSEKGVSLLAELRDLKVLSLRYVPLGDNALEHICKLRRLQELDLWGTKITDAGLPALVVLRECERMRLPDTVTDAGVKQLRRQLGRDRGISRSSGEWHCPQ